MSLLSDETGEVLPEKGTVCFYCHKTFEEEPIVWSGSLPKGVPLYMPYVFLHVGCTVKLCIRLLRDVHEWSTRYGDHRF